MLHKRGKRIGALVLAVVLAAGAMQFPSVKADAKAKNLALDATATASSQETADFGAGNANDGDRGSSRWASAIGDSAWFQLEWSEPQTMKAFRLVWERRNVQSYKLQVSDDGQTWREAYTKSVYPTETTEEIELGEAVTAKYLRLNLETITAKNPNFSETSWKTASLYEVEVFEDGIPDERPKAQIALAGMEIGEPQITNGRITMPQAPEGATVSFLADYEQVIGEDGTVYQPLKTKVIKGLYKVSCGPSEDEPDGSVAKTGEYTITVPGKYTDSENENPKPDVIPELQEWHGASGNFVAGSGSRIVIESDALSDMAKAFAEDYKEMTGEEIRVVKGNAESARIGDFYFSLTSVKKGLGKEGYTINISDTVVTEAEQSTGAYWATRSILQILKQTGGSIPKGEIRDYPKYEVRGFSLDVGRKPFDLDAMYQFAKNMAWYKMNSFQVHISDNLIFHEDYPDLETAANESYAGFRLESGVINPDTGKSATSEDVYCTKDEFRTFILDSRVMGVDIVPEFDMPAHALPFTRAFPQFMTKKAGGNHGYLIEEINLEKMDEVIPWVQSIWNDYFEGDNPVFDEEVTIHIGTDEYHGTEGQDGKEMFREFSDRMIEFVQGTGRTVRMWGSLSNKAGKTPVRSKDVQLNIWNTGYADPQNMYDMGYDLINTLEGPNYIVPAAGYYNNYIDAAGIYNNWKPNEIGNLSASAGDDQMLGGCYAMWHDSVDTRANGISQYDSFDRFFDPVSSYSAKLWGDPEKTYAELTEIKKKTWTAPGTTIYGEIDSVSSTIADYTFDGELTKDSGENGFDLVANDTVGQEATQDGHKALVLKGGKSYLSTPSKLNMVGSEAVLTMKVKMDADAEGEQILCESKNEFGIYGTYAFKASQKNTGKVGYSREGYDFSFDYTLPKDGTWHTLTFKSGKDHVSLLVDGELVDDNPDIYFANHPTTELTAKLSSHGIKKTDTMMVPLGRIGSKTNSFKGQIEFLTVTGRQTSYGTYGRISQDGWTAEACSFHTEGPVAKAYDGDPSTYWHQDHVNDKTVSDSQPHWYEVTFPEATEINQLYYLPRQSSTNGRVYDYGIEVTKEDGTKEMVVERGTWAANNEEKSASFPTIRAKKVKLLMYRTEGNHATIGELNFGIVNAEGLRTDLTELLSTTERYQAADYTDVSWAAFSEAKTFASQILANDSSSEEALFKAYSKLLDAAAKLIEMPEEVKDRYALSAAINEAEKELDHMEGGNAEDLKTKIDAAKSALKNADETADLSVLTDELLELTKKKALENWIATTENEISVSDPAQQEALRDALAAAKDALDNGGSLEELEEQKENLQISVRRSELTKAVQEAKDRLAAINKESFTAGSVSKLDLAIENAESVLVQSNASFLELTDALNNVRGTNLVWIPEITDALGKLNEAVTAAEKNVNDVGYTKASRDQLLAALNAAKIVLAKGDNITLDELTSAFNTLQGIKLEKEAPPVITKKELTPNTEYPVGSVIYKTTDKTNEVVVQKGEDTAKVVIESTVMIEGTECKIVGIAENAFKGYKSLKTVTIGDNVTSIGKQAFSGCKKLTAVTIGKSVTTIGKQAFYNSKKLKSLVIKSASLKKLPKDVFKKTKTGIKVNVKSLKANKRNKVFNLIKKAGVKKPKIVK